MAEALGMLYGAPVKSNVLIRLRDDGQDLIRLLATPEGEILDASFGMRGYYKGAQIIGMTDEDAPRLILTGAFGKDDELWLKWPIAEQTPCTAMTL